MEAPPPFFGYQIFAALDPLSSACNSEDAMTLPLHYRLVSSGDLFFMSFPLFVVSLFHGHLTMHGAQQMDAK
ncbi:hypothetical protein BV22DRAFT_930964, partial [Leucogyrophana mollusca]